jgi:hypothetical protein
MMESIAGLSGSAQCPASKSTESGSL